MLKGKKIVLGITGSIAAYKACLLIRQLIKRGVEVQVVITPAGKEFITPITLSALTHKPVISEFFSQRDGTWNSHVDLGLWADIIDRRTLIMPLDTHVVQEALRLGLLKSRTASMATARRLTDAMLEVFPDDPLRGDFALFGLGVDEETT